MLLPPSFLSSIFQCSPYSCSHMVCLLPKYHIVHTLIFSNAYPKKFQILTSTYAYFSTASPNIVHKKPQKNSNHTSRAASSPPVQLMSFRVTGHHTRTSLPTSDTPLVPLPVHLLPRHCTAKAPVQLTRFRHSGGHTGPAPAPPVPLPACG